MSAPEPPVVTIVDPSRPAEPVDVRGAEPRQLRRSHKIAAWTAVALALVTGGVVKVAQYVDRQHELDRQALADVSVGLTGSELFADGSSPVVLQLISVGKNPVTVVSVALDLPGLPAFGTTPTRLTPSAPTAVPVRVPTTCPTSVHGSPRNVLVTLRTLRGQEKTVKLPVSDGSNYLSDAVFPLLARCGGPVGPASIAVARPAVTPVYGTVPLTFRVTNRASVPREVVYQTDSGGLSTFDLNPPTPLRLSPGASGTFTLDLSVKDCARATAAWTPRARGGLTATVAGGGSVVLLPFDNARIRAFVSNFCDNAYQDSTYFVAG